MNCIDKCKLNQNVCAQNRKNVGESNLMVQAVFMFLDISFPNKDYLILVIMDAAVM